MMPGSKSMYKVKSALCSQKRHMGTLSILEVKGSKPPVNVGQRDSFFFYTIFGFHFVN